MKDKLINTKNKIKDILKVYSEVYNIPYSEYFNIDYEVNNIDIDWNIYLSGCPDYYGFSIPYEFLDKDLDFIRNFFLKEKETAKLHYELKKALEKKKSDHDLRIKNYNWYLELKKRFGNLTLKEIENDNFWDNKGNYIVW